MRICEITTDLSLYHSVKVWKNKWIIVSRHKYNSNAREVCNSIKSGATREEVKDIILGQDQRCNQLKLRYYENW